MLGGPKYFLQAPSPQMMWWRQCWGVSRKERSSLGLWRAYCFAASGNLLCLIIMLVMMMLILVIMMLMLVMGLSRTFFYAASGSLFILIVIRVISYHYVSAIRLCLNDISWLLYIQGPAPVQWGRFEAVCQVQRAGRCGDGHRRCSFRWTLQAHLLI